MPIVAPGSDWDTNNCIASAGYTWCKLFGRCIRLWETSCKIPENCLTWNDGCNMCSVENGKQAICTMMECFVQADPYCQLYAPDIQHIQLEPYPMPYDPLPENPFIGDGH